MSNSTFPNAQTNASGAMPVWITSGGGSATAIFSGQQAATTSAAALASQALVNSIAIIALSTNTGIIYVGPAGVTSSTGYPLSPGQAIGFVVANADAIYISGASSGVGSVAWTGN